MQEEHASSESRLDGESPFVEVGDSFFEHLRKTHFMLSITSAALLYVTVSSAPTWKAKASIEEADTVSRLAAKYAAERSLIQENSNAEFCGSTVVEKVVEREREALISTARMLILGNSGAIPSSSNTKEFASRSRAVELHVGYRASGGEVLVGDVDCSSMPTLRTIGEFQDAWGKGALAVRVSRLDLPPGVEFRNAAKIDGIALGTVTMDLSNYDVWSIQLADGDPLALRVALRTSHPSENVIVTIPVTKRTDALDLREALCSSSVSSGRQLVTSECPSIDGLDKMFPAVANYLALAKKTTADDFRIMVEGDLEDGLPAVKLLDNDISARDVSVVGALVVLGIQSYFLAHVMHLRRQRVARPIGVAWVALYPGGLARVVTSITLGGLPILAVGAVVFLKSSFWMRVMPQISMLLCFGAIAMAWMTLVQLLPRDRDVVPKTF